MKEGPEEVLILPVTFTNNPSHINVDIQYHDNVLSGSIASLFFAVSIPGVKSKSQWRLQERV